MSINLLQTVQENLGYPPLKKVDPNTQEVNNEPGDRFSQAAIPSVLTALYKYSRADKNAETLLTAGPGTDWTVLIFTDNRHEVIQKIAAYSGHEVRNVVDKLNRIADEAVRVIREQVSSGGVMDIKTALANSKNDVLPYLPASLQIGDALHDDTIDDRTHKMEGPVSSLMHAIGGSFSGSDSDEANNPK
jgi:hypothetical protein